jgi:hypothetical protein
LPGVGVDTTQEGPPDAAGNAVINADLVFNDDLAPGIGGHQKGLLQRRAFAAFVMSTTTVLDKGINSLCRVKYPTKKGHPRGTA